MRKVPEWVIQSIWFIAGVCATGALWFFLSIKEYWWALTAGIGAIVFFLLAIILHRSNDKVGRQDDARDEIVFNVKEEKITFNEMIRSINYDVVKVNAHTHILGVMAEHEWISRRYPKSKLISQALTTLEALEKKGIAAKKGIYFDIIKIALKDGRSKEIYFDISNFFTGKGSPMDPSSEVAEKLRNLYK